MSNTTIDWTRKVREFRDSHGYASYKDALDWLVERDSLETIFGLVGAEVVGDKSKIKPWLLSLGAWLKEQGYKAPPIYCPTNSYAFDSQTRVGENISITKKLSISSRDPSETLREYQRKVLLNLTLTEALIKASINELVEASGPRGMDGTGITIADEIMNHLWYCRTTGVDTASELSCIHCGTWRIKIMDSVDEQWKCAIDADHRYCEGQCSQYKPNLMTRLNNLFKRRGAE